MAPESVNLQSVDAMFATLLAETMQIKTMQREIKDDLASDRRRILALEQESANFKSRVAGAVAVISVLVGGIGFIVQMGLHKLFVR